MMRTIEELKNEIERREFQDFMYQMADRYTPSERKAKDENFDALIRLKVELRERLQNG